MNFFAKPSPKFKDEDLTSFDQRQLKGEDFNVMKAWAAEHLIRPASSNALDSFSNPLHESQSFQKAKIKFDLSKQID